MVYVLSPEGKPLMPTKRRKNMINFMSKKEFYKAVEEQIREYLPEEFKDAVIEINEVPKNNDIYLHGLSIRNGDNAAVPNLYLEGYYEELAKGESLESLLKTISMDYSAACQAKRPQVENMDFKFEAVKPNLVFQVVDMDLNKNRLKDLAYRPLGNGFAMTYAVRIEDMDGGSEGRIRISRDLVAKVSRDLVAKEKWDLIEVDKAATKNTSENMPAVLVSMTNRILGLNGVNYLDDDAPDFEAGEAMFILSNQAMVQGAAAFFYPGVQEKVAEVIGQSYFVIPSSIHELIIWPDDGSHSAKELGEMVKDVNKTEVSPEEILSYKVFRYDADSKILSTVFPNYESKKEKH